MEQLEQSIKDFEAWQRDRSARRIRIAALMRYGIALEKAQQLITQAGKAVLNGQLHTRQ